MKNLLIQSLKRQIQRARELDRFAPGSQAGRIQALTRELARQEAS